MSWLRMPRRNLRGHSGRLAMTVLALASAVALVCALDLINRAVLTAFVGIVDTMAGRASLQVSVGESGLFGEEVAERVAAVTGVEQVVAIVNASAFTTDDPGELLTIRAFDVTNPEVARIYQPADRSAPAIADPLVFLNQRDSIVVTRGFAKRRQLAEGDTLVLDTASGRHSFTVRGFMDAEGIARAFGDTLVVMDLWAAEAIFTQPGMVNQLDVVVPANEDVDLVAERIRSILPAGMEVSTAAQRSANLQAVMRSLQVILEGVWWVALGAVFLIAFNRLAMVYTERRGQLAILRAAGVRRRRVWRDLLTESLLLAAFAIALGVPAGVLLGNAIVPAIAATAALNFRTVAPAVDLQLHGASIALAAGLGVATAVLAALLPAWQATAVTIAEVLRRGASEEPSERGALRWWVSSALMAAAAAIASAIERYTQVPAYGLAATGLVLLSILLLVRPLLHLLTGLVQGRLRLWLGPTGRNVANELLTDPRRTGLIIAMIGCGLASVVWLAVVAHSFERTAERVFSQSMQADFVVSSTHIGAGALEMPVSDELVTTVEQVDGVASAVGVRLADWTYGGGPIVLDAFDPTYFLRPSYGAWPLHGAQLPDAWQQVADGRAVVVSSNFARNFDVTVGDTVTLTTPGEPLALVVAGITTDFASPRGTIEMSRTLYVQHWHDRRVTRVFAEAEPQRDPAEVRASILAALGTRGGAWRVISAGDLVAYWGAQIRRAFSAIDLLTYVILVVIVLGLIDNLRARVLQRPQELGTFRAVGLRRSHVASLVLLEALVLAALGLVFAITAGLTIASLWVYTTIPSLLGWTMDLEIPFGMLSVIALTTLASCGAAALIPGIQAARLNPSVALRTE